MATQKDPYDIMISYQWNSQEICKLIKKCLADNGYKVWIDIEQIVGHIDGTIAEAIESSNCVLMCVTKEYKDSEYCKKVSTVDDSFALSLM
jgi:hypothetical protein